MIKIFDGAADDFSGQGLGYVMPVKAEIEEESASIYEIELEVPIDKDRNDWLIDHFRIVEAKAPTRTSPEINFGLDGAIERQIFKAIKKAQMYNLSNKKKKLKSFKKNTKFVRLEVDDSWYKVAAVNGGQTGWVKANLLEYESAAEDVVFGDSTSDVIETVLAREQLFRITEIERDSEKMIVTARAEHITYDLIGVICEGKYEPENIPADEVVVQLLAKADQQDLPFKIYCECTDLITAKYTGRNLIDCLLNKDDGVVAQCNARFVRDNYNIYILKKTDRFTGAYLRYADNLIKADMKTDSGDTITRIRPVGKNKKGERLYITKNNGYVDSPNAANIPIKRTKEIEYSEAQTGKNGLSTDAKTRAKLEELAAAEFENGAGGINATIDAEFIRKELMNEYLDSANEAALHMYDIAKVKAGKAGIVANVRMTGYKFDALPGRERYIDATVSDLEIDEPLVYGINIGANSISGSKIQNNSLDANAKIKDLSIGIAKIDTAAIDQLNANSITALIARINEIVAGSVTTDELYAAIAEIVGLKVESITASDIATDRLAAALAAFSVITAGTASFDQATIKHLVAQAMNLSFGTAGDVFIDNLRVKFAQMVGATIGNLVIQASDGNYYRIDVDANGNVTSTPTTVSEGEIAAGETGDGRVILATNITAESLNTSNLLATYALINKIDAARIDVAELFANNAFIAHLQTTDISSNSYIQQSIINAATGEVERYVRQDGRGVIVGKQGSAEQLVLDEGSVATRINGRQFSKLASNFVEFGNYQLRRTADGGMAFKLKEG